jgi:hypothetical protein
VQGGGNGIDTAGDENYPGDHRHVAPRDDLSAAAKRGNNPAHCTRGVGEENAGETDEAQGATNSSR